MAYVVYEPPWVYTQQTRNLQTLAHLHHSGVLCHSLAPAPCPDEMELSPSSSQIHGGAAAATAAFWTYFCKEIKIEIQYIYCK